jgi:hypothetical protein
MLDSFHETIKRHGFEVEYSRDITSETAPTLEVASRMYREYVTPVAETLLTSLRYSVERRKFYRVLWSTIRRFFRKRLEKITGDFYEQIPRLLDKDNYVEKVKYMIFVLRKADLPEEGQTAAAQGAQTA